MELRQLKYFVKAAETENFSIAAQECFVVQSTLSQQIKQLEDDLGVQLFERIGKKVSLT
ncbi:MAG: LysR family transcriptional regulator, partial [Bacteroidaceae bacterium]|nr:LysR family transcriptional regulator [Bacteroidaceae bacterium]